MYENIKFNKPNLVVYDSLFYMFDIQLGMLVVKTSGGQVVTQVPLIQDISFTYYTNVTDILSLQYDGCSFWTLQKFNDNSGVLIQRWLYDVYKVSLHKQFNLNNTAEVTYDAFTFSIECYITKLVNFVSPKTTFIKIQEFGEIAVKDGGVIYICPKGAKEIEYVYINTVEDDKIFFVNNLKRSYEAGTKVVIVPTFILLNNYYLNNNSEGDIMVFNAETGEFIFSLGHGSEYKDIKAATYTRLRNIFITSEDVFSLAYVKGTSLKFKNVEDLFQYKACDRATDFFNYTDISQIDHNKWKIYRGDPLIQNSSLYSYIFGNGYDSLESNYYIENNFVVTVSGFINAYNTLSGTSESCLYNYLSVVYGSTTYDIGVYITDTFSGVRIRKNEVVVIDTSYSGLINNLFGVKVSRYNNDLTMSFSLDSVYTDLATFSEYYIEATIGLNFYGMYITTNSGTYFDSLVFDSSSYIRYKKQDDEFYGTMGMDNIRTDGSTIIPIYAISISEDNIFRLQNEAAYYGGNFYWSSYNYQISPCRPFIDFITTDAGSHIIPATGKNIVKITSVVKDQYGNGIINKPVFFIDDDIMGFMTSTLAYTDNYFGTGKVVSAYKSGTELRLVTITTTVTQWD